MQVDHIGYAVKQINKAIDYFMQLGFEFGCVVDDQDRNIRIAFGSDGNYRIELIQPLDKKKVSPVDIVLKKVGSSPYHICYKSFDLEKDIEQLVSKQFKVIIPPTPAVAFNGRRVVFLANLHVGLIEIVEGEST